MGGLHVLDELGASGKIRRTVQAAKVAQLTKTGVVDVLGDVLDERLLIHLRDLAERTLVDRLADGVAVVLRRRVAPKALQGGKGHRAGAALVVGLGVHVLEVRYHGLDGVRQRHAAYRTLPALKPREVQTDLLDVLHEHLARRSENLAALRAHVRLEFVMDPRVRLE